MFLGRRSTLMFWVCFAWFGGLRNNKTCPLTCLFQMPIRKSRTRPKAERWGLSTITWVSVIFSGLMKRIASSVKWATDRRPSESRAVKTQSQQTCIYLNTHWSTHFNYPLLQTAFLSLFWPSYLFSVPFFSTCCLEWIHITKIIINHFNMTVHFLHFQWVSSCARLCSRVTHSENLYVYLCPFIYTYSDTHTHSWVHVKVNQYELSRLKKYIGEAESMKINSLLSKDLSSMYSQLQENNNTTQLELSNIRRTFGRKRCHTTPLPSGWWT